MKLVEFVISFVQAFYKAYAYEFTDLGVLVLGFLGVLFLFLAFLSCFRMFRIGSVKVKAEIYNVKDETISGEGTELLNGTKYHTKSYMFGVKTPKYRYEYKGKLYIAEPGIGANTPKYNPLPGPCEIYISKRKPWKICDETNVNMSKFLLFCILYTFIFCGTFVGLLFYMDFSILSVVPHA